MGTFEYPRESNNWYQGIHQPMISEEQFDSIQTILGKKGKQRPRTHIFAFTGLMRCGDCKAMITCEEKIKRQKNGNVHRYVYYHCTKRVNPDCTQDSIEQTDLSKQILNTIENLKIPPEFHDWSLKWVKRENHKESADRNTILTQQQKAYKDCLEQLDELVNMRAAKEITPEEYAKKKSTLLKNKTRFKKLLDDTDDRATKWHKKADDMFDFARDAVNKFNNGGLEGKRYVLSHLGSNLLLRDKILTTNLEKTLIPMKEVAEEVKNIHERFKPVKGIDRTSQLETLYAQSPSLYPVPDCR
ncbi:hypothetical protein A3E42_02530 [Candidatus Gottesmanbacteria bacterium RIFCSPHIGHO2_12_FULL_40_13]|nr:MAG: hypothetical protein A3E42_02530 [Candidatus Gottesmanbacteria bacterium RIFCSPHIGHO2_12_FULL_40_13]